MTAAGDDEARGQALQAELKELQDERKRLQRERNDVRATIPAAMVMKERAEPRPAHILVRGAYDKPGEEVGRDTRPRSCRRWRGATESPRGSTSPAGSPVPTTPSRPGSR